MAEHEAAAYRRQVEALIRELQRANGADEELQIGSVFLFADEEPTEDTR
ncbi:hypothetical protein [Kitasatospora camelliae]|uniref:Uncharacterized protein n=1 Tax=Kitasatospora camelliae TaxID=3156397 RepID=A0AAU8K2G3_9ACTN